MKYLLDYHHHTNHSFDSTATMVDVCNTAVDKGIKEVCFTEHYSVNPVAPTYGHIVFKDYLKEIAECRALFNNQLIIKAGIELCEPHLLKDQYAASLAPLNLDFILGSIHNLNEQKLRIYLENHGEKVAYTNYFLEVLNMVRHADIDIIAHLDLLKRYAFPLYGHYVFEEYKDIVAAILETAIERNIGVEINTSGWRTTLNAPLPSIEILQLYRDLGGELLTIGSDSHAATTVGSHLEEAVLLAKSCGFKHVYKYEKRKPSPVIL
ncbi:histidinol-phosphatase HisJ family protein [Sporosarcina beigongshangi]|uniref:histidinol-phosphatase HisJ family protein n=1 Tax=Sporosarcina beigongshangi TaxID=2782538 RepID=UPI001939EB52|nr:histidinol-phosphatase HisJ family protein [Sporosarcina beigongshangi]